MATNLYDNSDLQYLPAAAQQDNVDPATHAVVVGPLAAAPALPGSLHSFLPAANTSGVYKPPTPLERERNRIYNILPQTTLVVVSTNLDVPNKLYARWKGAWLEVNALLLAKQICPADLLGVVCEFDEFPGGCMMVRLCSQVSKYTRWTCPDGETRRYRPRPDEIIPLPTTNCPHIHHEVKHSCRFVATAHISPQRICRLTAIKGGTCPGGHDFPHARQQARDRAYIHQDDARRAGSVGRVLYGWQF